MLIAIPTAKKEAKRLEKEAKLAAKVAKVAATTPAGEKKAKAEKEKKEEEAPFVNNTPKGQKKGAETDIVSINIASSWYRPFRTYGKRLQPDSRRIRLVRLVARRRVFQACTRT